MKSNEIRLDGTLDGNIESNKVHIKKNANIIICSNFSERIIYKSLKTFRDKGMKTYNLYDSKIK